MKKKIFLITILILMFIAIYGLQVLGVSTISTIKAYINNSFNLTLNGKKFIPLDEDGSALTPIIYNDRTYLPVRAIANALDIKIDWNNDTKTVIIGEDKTNPIDEYNNMNIKNAYSTYEISYIANNYYEGWKNEFENLAKILKEQYVFKQDKESIDKYIESVSNLALDEAYIIAIQYTDTNTSPEERVYGTGLNYDTSYSMAEIYKNAFYKLMHSNENIVDSYEYIFKTPKDISEL